MKKEIKSLTRALSRLFLCSWKAAGLFRAVYRNRDALTSWCSVAGTDVHILVIVTARYSIDYSAEYSRSGAGDGAKTPDCFLRELNYSKQLPNTYCVFSQLLLWLFKYSCICTHLGQCLVFDIEELCKENVKLVIKRSFWKVIR